MTPSKSVERRIGLAAGHRAYDEAIAEGHSEVEATVIASGKATEAIEDWADREHDAREENDG